MSVKTNTAIDNLPTARPREQYKGGTPRRSMRKGEGDKGGDDRGEE
jgi:hypothetical protein